MANGLAVVTGASSGIGLELAKVLAGRGYDLVMASAGDRLSSAAEELRALSVAVTEVTLTWPTSRESMSYGLRFSRLGEQWMWRA